MQHLRPEDLVDLADGTRAEPDEPHLAVCDACRAQLADLRATMALAVDVEVPEPSPLFWDHFSARVSHAVEHERATAPEAAFWRMWSRSRLLIPVSAVAVAAVVLSVRMIAPGTVPQSPVTTEWVRAQGTPLSQRLDSDVFSDALGAPDDASLTLVADLTADLSWEAIVEAGLAQDGSAEHAVTHLSAVELQELQRLLQLELAGRGV